MIYLLNSDARQIPLVDKSVQCVVTSPPYWGLRDYGISDQIGLESTPAAYVAHIVAVMRECWRVLKDDGVLWLNIGDSYNSSSGSGNQSGILKYQTHHSYAESKQHEKIGRNPVTGDGLKPKDLCGIPWRVAFALQDAGWYLRSDIIWSKPNPMPESVTDRPTKAHEYVFLLTKRERYYYDAEAIREPLSESTQNDPRMKDMGRTYNGKGRGAYGENVKANGQMEAWTLNPSGRNRRSVWTVATQPYSGAKGLADYVGDDGKPYKASPDCPIHGHLAREKTSYTVGYDAPLNQNQSRNAGSDNGHEQAPASLQSATTYRNSQDGRGENVQTQNLESIDDYRSEAHHPEYTAPAQTVDRTNRTLEPDAPSDRKSDLKRREYSLSANGHNKRKSKTARARRTSQHDTASEEIPDHIQNTLPIDERFDSGDHIDESNTLGDYASSEIGLSAETSYRNAGIDSPFVTSHMSLYCTCEVVSTDHFATFPPALIEPMILAGTSARGECPHCGKAWVRVVEKIESDNPAGYNGSKFTNGKTAAAHPDTGNGKRYESSSVGWRPQCACYGVDPLPDYPDEPKDNLVGFTEETYRMTCEAISDVRRIMLEQYSALPTVQQTVLDPFAGSGTTGAVAVKHGRRAVLLDLNTKYIDLQFDRTSKVQITMQM